MNQSILRRDFMKTGALLAGTTFFPFNGGLFANPITGNPIPYENRMQDHLWMWGHDTGVYDGPNNSYKIPVSENISMADSIKLMGIPNVCVIRWGAPDEKYLEQFKSVKRLAWVISGNIPQDSYARLSKIVYPLLDKLPNLTGVFLDDFFNAGKPIPVQTPAGRQMIAPSDMTYAELTELNQRLEQRRNQQKKAVEIGVVLYSGQLRPEIVPLLDKTDFVSYWIWSGKDINRIDTDFKKYRQLAPKKRTQLGIYMWNFGECKPLELDLMKIQLDYAGKLYEKGDIEGMIFHCTPLCNKNIEAVEYAKKWIAEHADMKQ